MTAKTALEILNDLRVEHGEYAALAVDVMVAGAALCSQLDDCSLEFARDYVSLVAAKIMHLGNVTEVQRDAISEAAMAAWTVFVREQRAEEAQYELFLRAAHQAMAERAALNPGELN
jgi:hypothetical protein